MLRERQNRFLRLLLAGMVLTLGLVGPSWGETPVTSSLWIPLEGTIQVGEDTVTLSGKVHVMTHVTIPLPPDPSLPVEVQVHANLAGGEGIGNPSGWSYRAVGGDWTLELAYGELLIFVLEGIVFPEFEGQDVDSFPLPLRFSLNFDELWNLTEARAVPCQDCDRIR